MITINIYVIFSPSTQTTFFSMKGKKLIPGLTVQEPTTSYLYMLALMRENDQRNALIAYIHKKNQPEKNINIRYKIRQFVETKTRTQNTVLFLSFFSLH